MKKSLSLTLLIITGFALFSVASCGSSTQPQAKSNIPEAAKQIAKANYSYDEEEAGSAASSTAKNVTASVPGFKGFSVYTDAETLRKT